MVGLVLLGGTENNVIEQAEWDLFPSSGELNFPARTELPVTAQVRLLCEIVAEGRLRGCKVEQEAPENRGFAEEALNAVPHFRHRTVLSDGRRAVGLKVRFVIRWGISG